MTVLWDAAAGEVRPARAKEGSDDYRYFPEPDLPPLVLAQTDIDAQRAALPELPAPRRERFVAQYSLSPADAAGLTATASLADYFELVARAAGDAKLAANWVMGEVLAIANAEHRDLRQFAREAPVPAARLGALIAFVKTGAISGSAAKQVFTELRTADEDPRQIATRLDLLQVGDDTQLTEWIDRVFAENPVETARFLDGERRLQGVLVGLAMKMSGGRADPKKLSQLLAGRVRG
jgi:aspartyl-tRNA(Asn)/glutamyl-tRNA(Gln) amidotransferase subunit B